jgi:hypothetical protein
LTQVPGEAELAEKQTSAPTLSEHWKVTLSGSEGTQIIHAGSTEDQAVCALKMETGEKEEKREQEKKLAEVNQSEFCVTYSSPGWDTCVIVTQRSYMC